MQNEGYSILMNGVDDWTRTFWLTVRGFDRRSGRANRRAPKKSHTAIVNWSTDGGRPVCLSAANRPLMRALGIAHLAPSHFEISG